MRNRSLEILPADAFLFGTVNLLLLETHGNSPKIDNRRQHKQSLQDYVNHATTKTMEKGSTQFCVVSPAEQDHQD